MPERIGVQVTIDTSQLNSGVAAYERALDRLTSATQSALPKLSFEKTFENLKGIQRDLDALTNVLTKTGVSASSLQSNFGNVSRSLNQFVSQIDRAANQSDKLVRNLSSLTQSTQSQATGGLRQFTDQITAMGNAMSNSAASARTLASATRSIKTPVLVPSAARVATPAATPVATSSAQPVQLSSGLASTSTQIAQTAPAATKALQEVAQAVNQTAQAANAAAQPLKLVLKTVAETTQAAAPAAQGLKNVAQAVTQTAQAAPKTAQSLQSVAKSTAQVAQTAPSAQQALKKVSDAAQQTAQNVSKAASETSSSTKSISSSFDNLGLRIAAGVAVGNAAVQGFRALISGTVAATREIIDSVGFWERLGFSVSFYAAQARQAQGDTREYTDILNSVQTEAEGTVAWLQRLAVLSPFTAQQVATVYRTARAYGLTQDAAQNLLPKLLDLAAAGGLDADVLQRIALALGQVEARGKLTGEEIRQLGNAGIPIKNLLIDNLDIANSEFEDLVEKGVFTADIVIPLITDSLEAFDGAAAKVSTETISGLINALTEIRQISEAKLFSSIFKAVQPQLQKLVEAFSGTEVPALLQAIGEQIGAAFASILQSIQNFVGTLINAWNSLDEGTRDSIIIFVAATAAFIALGLAIAGVTAIVVALINPITVLAAAFAGFITWWTQGATVLDEFQVAYIDSINIIGTSTEAVTETITGWAESTEDATETVSSGLEDVGDSAVTFSSVISKTLSSVVSAVATTASRITQFFSDIADAFRWGLETGQTWASGLISSMTSVIRAVNIVGSAISGLMAPASPPKFLKDIDKWGRDTMQIYLDSFSQADFGVINDLGNTLRQLLNADILRGQSEADVLERVIGGREAITRAIGEIVKFGKVNERTFAEIRRFAGSASDEIEAYLSIYARVSKATREEISLQERLNSVREKYEGTLKGLNEQLNRVTESQKRASEAQEISELQRVVNRVGVGDTRAREAQSKIQQILIKRQIRGVEQQQSAEENRLEAQLKAAEQARKIAEEELDLLKERIGFQNEGYQLQLNYNQAVIALKSAFGGVDEVASSVNNELQNSLRAIQLQQDELSDLERLFRAQLVLNDANATAAQKAAAALVVAEVSVRQQLRDAEAASLGITLEDLRSIQFTLADIQKNGAGGALGPDFTAPNNEQNGSLVKLNEAFGDLQEQLTDAREKVIEFTETVKIKFNELNGALPSWLKLWTQDGESPALNLAIVAGGFFVVTGMLGKLKNSIGAIVGVFSGAKWLLTLFGLTKGGAAAAGGTAAAAGTGGFVAALTAALPATLAASVIAGLALVVYKLFTDEDWQETANNVATNINKSIGNYLLENAPGFSAYLATNYVQKVFGKGSEVEKEVELTGASIGSAFALSLLSKLTSLLPKEVLNTIGLGLTAGIRQNLEKELEKSWNTDPGFDVEEPKIEFALGAMFETDGRTAGQKFVDGFVSSLNTNQIRPFTFSGLINSGVQGLDKLLFPDQTKLNEDAKAVGQTIVNNVAQGLNTTESQTSAADGGLTLGTNILKPIYGPKSKEESQIAGQSFVGNLLQGFNTPQSQTSAANGGLTLSTNILKPIYGPKSKEEAQGAGANIVTNLADGLKPDYKNNGYVLNNAIINVLKGVSAQVQKEESKTLLGNTGSSIVKSIADGTNTPKSQEVAQQAARWFVGNLTQGLNSEETQKSLYEASGNSSAQIVLGIEAGIKQDGTWASRASDWITQKLLDEINRRLGIQSPSTVMRDEVGIPIAEGILVGIQEFSGSDTTKYSQTIIDDFKTGLDTIILNTGEQLTTFSTNFLLSISTLSTNVLLGITTFGDSIKLAYSTIFGDIALGVSLFSTRMQETFTTLNTTVNEKQNLMLAGLNESFDSFAIAMTGNEEAKVPVFASTFVSVFETMRGATNKTMNTLKNNVISSFENGEDGLIDILKKTYTKEDTSNPAYAFGIDFITAIRKGMESQADALSGSLGALLSGALDDVRPDTPSTPTAPTQPAQTPPAPTTRRARTPIAMGESSLIPASDMMNISSTINGLFGSIPSKVASSGIVTNNYIRNYNLTVNSGQASDSIVSEFGYMELVSL